MGSAFLAMNSSTGMPSIIGGRGTRFCFPLMKIVMYFSFRSRRARFSAAVRLRFGFRICVSRGSRVHICRRELKP
jgi:hypothetical protein